jgi:hypothetical protein
MGGHYVYAPTRSGAISTEVTMKGAIGVLAVLGVLLPLAADAQAMPRSGDRIRVHHTDGRILTGVVESVSTDRLSLQADGGPEVTIRPLEIASLEKSVGEHRNFGKNFGIAVFSISLATGLGAALLWTPLCSDPPSGLDESCPFDLSYGSSRGEALSWGLAAGAIVGLPFGVLYGLVTKHERWAQATTPSESFGKIFLTPTVAGGVSVVGSISFRGL